MDKLTDVPEENPDTFTLADWDRVKGAKFKADPEASEKVRLLMTEAHKLATEHGIPFCAVGVDGYDGDSYTTFCSSSLTPLDRVPPELLAIYSCANNGYHSMLQIIPEINQIMYGSPEAPKSGIEALLELLAGRREE